MQQAYPVAVIKHDVFFRRTKSAENYNCRCLTLDADHILNYEAINTKNYATDAGIKSSIAQSCKQCSNKHTAMYAHYLNKLTTTP